jgi:vacuolar-type H+-ATPase subunit H
MIKKFLISLLLGGSIFSGSILTNIESEAVEVQNEFYYEDSEYTIQEKNTILEKAMSIVEEHLSNLSFGGNSYDK